MEARYVKTKARKIEYAVKRKIELSLGASISSNEETETQNPEGEIIEQLKEKFKICSKNSEKLQILTILPKSWTWIKIMEEFKVSEYMVRKAKKLVSEKGILTTPNPKFGNTLPATTVNLVKQFYNSDEISRVMPERKILYQSQLMVRGSTCKSVSCYAT